MRIRVNDPDAAVDLSEFLKARIGAIVEQLEGLKPGGKAELEVSLLGSYSEEALREELEAALKRWSMLGGHRAAEVELE
jgi:hypothetical protein